MSARPPEVTKVLRRLSHARREVVRALERAAEVHDQIGLLPGHLAEMKRRCEAIRDEADKAIKVFGDERRA